MRTKKLLAFMAVLPGSIQAAEANGPFISHEREAENLASHDAVKIEADIHAGFTGAHPAVATFGPAALEADGNITNKLTTTPLET